MTMYAALEQFRPHHQELRSRLLRILAGITLATITAYVFAKQIAASCMVPLFAAHPGLERLVYTNLTEAFVVYIKLALIVGIMVSFPHTLLQLWRFVAPGLLDHEKRLGRQVVLWGSLLFAGGVLFAFFVVLPRTLAFLMSYAGPNLVAMPKLGRYLTFVARLCLALGIAFELPFLMVMAASSGLVTADYFRRQRKYFYVVIVVLAFLLTAGDLVATLLASFPLFGLYEAGTAIGRALARKNREVKP